jgi:hypothetical protein
LGIFIEFARGGSGGKDERYTIRPAPDAVVPGERVEPLQSRIARGRRSLIDVNAHPQAVCLTIR